MKLSEYLKTIDIDELTEYAKTILGIELFDFQVDALKNICQGKVVRMARGLGRSSIIYVLSHYVAYQNQSYQDGKMVLKKLENNRYDIEPDVVYPYSIGVESKFGTLEFYKKIKGMIQQEAFQLEYECKGVFRDDYTR